MKKFLAVTLGGLAALYAGLSAVFYFDLDGKLLYHVVEPFPCRHYDRIERRDITKAPYDMDKYGKYEYSTE